jgi:hypothetical protein
VSLGIVEEPDREALHRRVRAHHLGATQLLDLIERGADVRNLDVEGDVARVSLRTLADAAADTDPVRVQVLLARDD